MNLKTLLFIILGFTVLPIYAQDETVEMADLMYSSGKIYVVVAVLLVIFLGITGYLITIDKKVSKLEKETQSK